MSDRVLHNIEQRPTLEERMEASTQAVLAAIAEKPAWEIAAMAALVDLSERIAVLESRHN